MTLKDFFETSLTGLKINKSRSALTTLGIVIGITAIILVMSTGQAAERLIVEQIQGLGSKTIAVVPGREPTGPSDFAQVFSDSLREKDLAALKRKENVPTLGEIMPVVFGAEAASYGNETYRATIFGASELGTKIFDIYPSEGTFFTNEDVRSRADVVVLGARVKDELFGPSDAIGQKIKMKNKSFRVTGILPAKGQVSFFNFDDMAVMPHTTAQQYIFGIKYFHRFIIQADSEENISQTVRDIETTLRLSHGITDPEKDDFFIETQADILSRISIVTTILTLLLTSIAAISLVVGGIGIMNIMLVSVTERTREIGLRKAIGATEKDIMIQFLLESVMLTALGGIIGIALGAGLSLGISLALGKIAGLDWGFSFPVAAAVLGISVSTLVGLIFGLYPARKASLKSPIEALGYE